MQVYPDAIGQHLSRHGLAPVWLIGGDELLLVEECLDEVRKSARDLGYSERQVYHVESGFRWESLQEGGANLSLFSELRLIEVRLPNGKPGDAGSKALVAWAQNPPPDTCLLVVCGGLDSSARRAKWYKTLDGAGVSVQCWPIDRSKLPQWINRRLQSRGVQADRDAVAALAQRVEGNLLAAAQDIEKLALLFPNQTLSAEQVDQVVADSARFNVFGLAEAVFSGHADRALRQLLRLKSEGLHVVPIIAVLQRELHDVMQLAGGSPLSRRTWPQREQQLRKWAGRSSVKHWQQGVESLRQADATGKGQQQGDAWLVLERVCMDLAN